MQIINPSPEQPLNRRTPMFIDHEIIRITKNGTWLSDGEEIGHDQTLRAYKKHLDRDEEGYFIRIGNNFKRIEVEDCAFFIELAFKDPTDGQIKLRVSDDTEIVLDLSKLSYRPGRLTIRIRDGKEEARFLQQAYHWTLLQLDEKFLKGLESKSGV